MANYTAEGMATEAFDASQQSPYACNEASDGNSSSPVEYGFPCGFTMAYQFMPYSYAQALPQQWVFPALEMSNLIPKEAAFSGLEFFAETPTNATDDYNATNTVDVYNATNTTGESWLKQGDEDTDDEEEDENKESAHSGSTKRRAPRRRGGRNRNKTQKAAKQHALSAQAAAHASEGADASSGALIASKIRPEAVDVTADTASREPREYSNASLEQFNTEEKCKRAVELLQRVPSIQWPEALLATQKHNIVEAVVPITKTLALLEHGSRVVQEALVHAKVLKGELLEQLQGCVKDLYESPHGNHVCPKSSR